MESEKRMRVATALAQAAIAVFLVAAAPLARAQAARYLGAVTAISGDTLTVKTDAGEVREVQVPAAALLKRIEPGQTDLSKAEPLDYSSIATGDRVLVRLDPNAAAGTTQALQVITLKQAALAAKQAQDQKDWQQRGVSGLVKSVDAASGTIMVTSGAGSTAKTITVHVDKQSVLKRYAPASVRYDLAQVAPIDAIHEGDQFRARGAKNAAGTEITAEEVVSGSFRNISGTITSIDAASSNIVVKDLATKKQVTIHVGADAQLHRLADTTATMLAAVLNGNSSGFAGRMGAPGAGRAPGAGGPGAGGGMRAAYGGGGGGFDVQQMLSRAPAIQLSDLKKSEAVMVVATEDATGVSVITLMAGVEPLLEAPAASENLLNWSLSSGSPDAGGAQ